MWNLRRRVLTRRQRRAASRKRSGRGDAIVKLPADDDVQTDIVPNSVPNSRRECHLTKASETDRARQSAGHGIVGLGRRLIAQTQWDCQSDSFNDLPAMVSPQSPDELKENSKVTGGSVSARLRRRRDDSVFLSFPKAKAARNLFPFGKLTGLSCHGMSY